MAHDVCQINGPGDLDLLTLKLWVGWGTFVPNLDMLGLRVLQLFAMYVTDGQTDKSNAYCPLSYGRGITISHISIVPAIWLERPRR